MDFDGAYDRPRAILQVTRPGPFTYKRHTCTPQPPSHCIIIIDDDDGCSSIRWAENRIGRAEPVRELDGRVPVAPTRRVPVSDGVVAL